MSGIDLGAVFDGSGDHKTSVDPAARRGGIHRTRAVFARRGRRRRLAGAAVLGLLAGAAALVLLAPDDEAPQAERFEGHPWGSRLPDGFPHARECVEVYDLLYGENVTAAVATGAAGFADQAQRSTEVLLGWTREGGFSYPALETVIAAGADTLGQLTYALRQTPADTKVLGSVEASLGASRAGFELACPAEPARATVGDDGSRGSRIAEDGTLEPVGAPQGSLPPLPEADERSLRDREQPTAGGGEAQGTDAVDEAAERASRKAAREAAELAKREASREAQANEVAPPAGGDA